MMAWASFLSLSFSLDSTSATWKWLLLLADFLILKIVTDEALTVLF